MEKGILLKLFLGGLLVIILVILYFLNGVRLAKKYEMEIRVTYLGVAPQFFGLLIVCWPFSWWPIKNDLKKGGFKR